MKKAKEMLKILVIAMSIFIVFTAEDCNDNATSTSGVKRATVAVETNESGKTTEQINIITKLENDNKVGVIKHLYVISPYSGQVILYSTVLGKVTSSNKRLSPKEINNVGNSFAFEIEGRRYFTDEVLGDDGTYSSGGGSTDYIYWADSKQQWHQHFLTGGQIVHVSDRPMAVKSVIINVEISDEK